MRRILLLRLGASAAFAVVAAASAHAYVTYAYWAAPTTTFYVNPANADVSAAAAIAAVKAGMDSWNLQAGTPFRIEYGGTVTDTARVVDNRNVVFFRPNYSSGSTIASTYTWRENGRLVDADITFYTTDWTFYTGGSGCSGSRAIYIEDVAAHEFGHAIGVTHSQVTDATMYPSTTNCSQAWRTLALDDIAAARSLYGTGVGNTAPAVSITAPLGGTSYAEGTSISFSGASFDTQDGNISSGLQWTDNGNSIGQGGAFSRVLTVGTHTIVARSTDSGGLEGSRQVSVTVTAASSGGSGGSTGPTLNVSGRKVKGLQKADLTWNGLSASAVDVYRNGSKVMGTANDGRETDPIDRKGAATYSYKVCAVGTNTCSNTASVVF